MISWLLNLIFLPFTLIIKIIAGILELIVGMATLVVITYVSWYLICHFILANQVIHRY